MSSTAKYGKRPFETEQMTVSGYVLSTRATGTSRIKAVSGHTPSAKIEAVGAAFGTHPVTALFAPASQVMITAMPILLEPTRWAPFSGALEPLFLAGPAM